MRYSEARPGRVFVIRLEQGEVVHEVLERFAADKGVRSAAVLMVGGADKGSRLVVGPEDGDALPVIPLGHVLSKVHEMAAVGTLFPDEAGRPSLHVHAALGLEGGATVGCIRRGVVVWLILEVIMLELTGTEARRVGDPATGFELLEP
jgi:predicted DNA-binding protein with PD1-like motif